MSLFPSPSLGLLHSAPGVLNQKIKARERALILIFAMAALAAGALPAVASNEASAFAGGLLLIALAAWALPLTWLGPVLAALIPFQLYLWVPATSFTLRAALVFVFAATARILVSQPSSPFVLRPSSLVGRRSSFAWLLPAAVFILAALFAALSAPDRYSALKGIYDWLIVFLTAFVIAALAPSVSLVRRILSILIIGGVVQALLGLLQYILGLDTILGLLRLPASGLLYQPNLLRDRLSDLSFNWVNFDRALPFGTFINGIDYAVFLAAILSLAIALVISRAQPRRAVCHCEEPRSGDEAIPNMADAVCEGLALTAPSKQVRKDAASFQQTQGQPSLLRRQQSFAAIAGPRSSVPLAIAAVPIAIALLLTFKGSGVLALLGGLAAIGLASVSHLSKRIVTIGLVVAIGAFIIALPFADLIGQRAEFLVQREQGSFGTAGRLQIWESLVQSLGERPLFGYGLNNATTLIAPQRTLRDGAPGFVFSTPESAYVSALVETGLVGFVALMTWLLAAVAKGYQRARAGKEPALFIGMVAALVAVLFGNLTVSGLTTDQNGMLLGMLIGLIYGSQSDD